MSQEQTTKPAPKEQEETKAEPKDLSSKKEELKEDLDALIDEIDGVLEEDCETFVKNYVQRGGE